MIRKQPEKEWKQYVQNRNGLTVEMEKNDVIQ